MASVTRSPRLAATGVATLSGLIWSFLETEMNKKAFRDWAAMRLIERLKRLDTFKPIFVNSIKMFNRLKQLIFCGGYCCHLTSCFHLMEPHKMSNGEIVNYYS